MPYEYAEDAEEFQVCASCVSEPLLKAIIVGESRNTACTYCRTEGRTIALGKLADRVHEVFDACFVRTGEGGYEAEELIGITAGVDDAIARDIRLYLSDFFGHQAALDGEEDPYGEEAYYEEGRPDGQQFSRVWHDFREQLLEKTRFFIADAASTLESIFGDLTIWKGAVREIHPEDPNGFVYRARITDHAGAKGILANPARELGPPPVRYARAGRMNAAGISVFYGAEDLNTCLAELRAPVSSSVVGGRFCFLRPVHLLDLNALAKPDRTQLDGSIFDANVRLRRERAAFFRQLVFEVSRPVMPSDEALDYLPSQAIAEFLAMRSPPLDGMIFSSSQTGGQGRNIVLFHHASRVKDETIADVAIDWNEGPEDDPDDPIRVSAASETHPFLSAHFGPGRLVGPTLRIDPASVQVLQIAGVRYDYSARAVRYVSRGSSR